MEQRDIDYHRARATQELNIGLTCHSPAAARAHLRLSSLHFERARDLQGSGTPPERPLFVM